MSTRKERRERFNLKRFLKGLSGPEHDAALARAYGAGDPVTVRSFETLEACLEYLGERDPTSDIEREQLADMRETFIKRFGYDPTRKN
jgi:hypothetical protein